MITNSIKNNINGILLLDKALNITSNRALQIVKRLFCAKKAGHTGSLDPLATGMLPICLGEATKFSQYLLESDKHYRVQVKLGIKTTTGDTEGNVILTKPVENLSLAQIENVLQKFMGVIQQVPPMFSAIKQNGKPLYELARQGIEVERAPRTLTIFNLQCDTLHEDTFYLNVHCSKGTYVRTLVEDIADQLGTCGHVLKLHRLCVAPYQQTKMISFTALEELYKMGGLSALYNLLLPIESSVQDLPVVQLSTSSAFYLRTGQPVRVSSLPSQGMVRLYDGTIFIGVGEVTGDGRIVPRRLIAA